MGALKIPEENIIAFSYLYSIENTLRELIIKSLSCIDGSHWYKKRLPGDILDKYRNAMRFERALKWCSLVPHHPIYYVDFPDLRKIIERNDNWRDAFKSIFLRKDYISNTFSELEITRNKVAHNRKVAKQDINNVKVIYTKLRKYIGEDEYDELSSKNTCLMDIPQRLMRLRDECKNTFDKCTRLGYLKKPEIWASIRDEWWFDESYFNHSLSGIQDYFTIIEKYCEIERTRGIGHKIESWVKSSKIREKYEKAQIEFSTLLEVMQYGPE